MMFGMPMTSHPLPQMPPNPLADRRPWTVGMQVAWAQAVDQRLAAMNAQAEKLTAVVNNHAEVLGELHRVVHELQTQGGAGPRPPWWPPAPADSRTASPQGWPSPPENAAQCASPASAGADETIKRLQCERAELRAAVDSGGYRLKAAAEREKAAAEREADLGREARRLKSKLDTLESLLKDKEAVIDALHAEMLALQVTPTKKRPSRSRKKSPAKRK